MTEYGVPGAGVCDLAARYSNAAHKLGLRTISFIDHLNYGVDLALVPPEDNVTIWKDDDGGGQDLTITNDTGKTVRLVNVTEGGTTMYVYGWLE